MMIFTDSKEKEKREELRKLYAAWEKVIKQKSPICSPVDEKNYDPITYFNIDGFYPGYFSTRPRILFIGRESRQVGNDDGNPIDRIIEDNPDCWLSDVFYRRILFLVYGIRGKGKYQFENIRLEQVLEKMIKNNNFGFALMNISKYSNCAENDGSANYPLINKFLEDSDLEHRNFIREEIELYEPNVIITLNLWEGNIRKKFLNLIFPKDDLSEPKYDKNENVQLQNFILNGKSIKLVNTYHFWARGKSDKKHFYYPVIDLLFKK